MENFVTDTIADRIGHHPPSPIAMINRTFLVRFGSISAKFSLAMVRLGLARRRP